MKRVMCALLLLALGCDEHLAVGDRLSICRAICGDRQMDDFSVSGYNDNGFSCRCGQRPDPSPCDAGKADPGVH